MIGMQFVDVMDYSRTLIPVRESSKMYIDKQTRQPAPTKTVVCRVYFKDAGYAGDVELSASLFTDRVDGFLGHVGFVLASHMQAKQEEMARRDQKRDKRSRDNRDEEE